MPFVPTGFPALNRMLAGKGPCAGFMRGGLTLIGGAPGGGKSQLMRECCSRAHKKGLKVVYITSEEEFRAEYPVRELTSLDEVARLIANLLHPGKREKTDLMVLDSITHMVPDNNTTDNALAGRTVQLNRLFNAGFGNAAVVGTFQSSREMLRNISHSNSMTNQASVVLNVSNSNSVYYLNLVKSRVSESGVSCEIRLNDSDIDYFDRSKIPTRYQRILRGRD